MLDKIKKAWDYVLKNPVKALIILTVISLGLCLAYLLIKEFVIPLFIIVVFIWAIMDLPIPQLNNQQVSFNFEAIAHFMLEIMTVLHERIYILKPFGIESLHLADKPFKDFYAFTMNADMVENAPFDDTSLAEIKYILQERINDCLLHNKAYGIPCTIYANLPALVVKNIFVAGSKYIYEVVWVNNKAAFDYLNNGNNFGDGSTPIQPNDDKY